MEYYVYEKILIVKIAILIAVMVTQHWDVFRMNQKREIARIYGIKMVFQI